MRALKFKRAIAPLASLLQPPTYVQKYICIASYAGSVGCQLSASTYCRPMVYLLSTVYLWTSILLYAVYLKCTLICMLLVTLYLVMSGQQSNKHAPRLVISDLVSFIDTSYMIEKNFNFKKGNRDRK